MKWEERILYEDNHLIAVYKLNGEPVQSDETGDEALIEKVKSFIRQRDRKLGNVFLGLIHRLDRPTSGIVLFAKTSKALSRMNEQFRNRETGKRYYAVLEAMPPEEEGTLVGYLKKNGKKNKSFVFETQVRDSKRAELNYRLIGCSDRYFCVEIELLTGRHHQIRAQFAHAGMPIRGDVKYGSKKALRDNSIMLHAGELTFLHPISKEKIVLKAKAPHDPLWRYFDI